LVNTSETVWKLTITCTLITANISTKLIIKCSNYCNWCK